MLPFPRSSPPCCHLSKEFSPSREAYSLDDQVILLDRPQNSSYHISLPVVLQEHEKDMVYTSLAWIHGTHLIF